MFLFFFLSVSRDAGVVSQAVVFGRFGRGLIDRAEAGLVWFGTYSTSMILP